MNPFDLARLQQTQRATSGANLFASRAANAAIDTNNNNNNDNINDDDDDDDFQYLPLAAQPVTRTPPTAPRQIAVFSDTVKRKDAVVNDNAQGSTVVEPTSGRLLPSATGATNARPSSGEYVFVGNGAPLASVLKRPPGDYVDGEVNELPNSLSYVAVPKDLRQYEPVPPDLSDTKPTPVANAVPMQFAYEHVSGGVMSDPPQYERVPGAVPGTMPLYEPMAMMAQNSDALVLSDDEAGDDGPAPAIGKSKSRPTLQRTRADKELVVVASRQSNAGSRIVVTVMITEHNVAKRIMCDPQTTCGVALDKIVGGFRKAGIVGNNFNAADHQLSLDAGALSPLWPGATIGAALGIAHGNAPMPLFVVPK
jgi:hypothetical protein